MNDEILIPEHDRLVKYAEYFETLDLRRAATELLEFMYTDSPLSDAQLKNFRDVMAERFREQALNVENFYFSRDVIQDFMRYRQVMRTRDAARLAGMSPRRFRAALFGFGFPTRGDHLEFLRAEANADLMLKGKLASVVLAEAEVNAKMALTVLERKYPKEWGPVREQSPVTVNNVMQSYGDRAAKNAARLRELREQRTRKNA